jgi:glycosyltransferase involved in cell wall biosynthesis
MKSISIAIPAYDYHNKGEQFLDDLLRTIKIQTFKNFEVIITDHSENEYLRAKAEEYSEFFSIRYYHNNINRGNSPANLNTAISYCEGEIIKPMFQDDFFYDDEALERIYYNLSADHTKQWLLCGTNHTRDNGHTFVWELFPRFNDRLLDGVNTISSPSVMAFKKSVNLRFDENLIYLMDIDFYYNMRKTYGDPIYYDDILVTNRIHPDSISATLQNREELLQKESIYCKQKYD